MQHGNTSSYSYELYHHGILGQKWGKRNGPPYPLGAGDHSAAEKKAGWQKSLGKGSMQSAAGGVGNVRIKRRSTVDSEIGADIKAVCPEWNKHRNDPDWTNNCTSCVVTYAARRNGHDVTAKPLPKQCKGQGRTPKEYADWFQEGNAVYAEMESSQFMLRKRILGTAKKYESDFAERITQAYSDAPNGAYGIVSAHTPFGGHVFIWHKQDGGIRFADPQAGDTASSPIFQNVSLAMGMVGGWSGGYYCRMDNKNLREDKMSEYCTPVSQDVRHSCDGFLYHHGILGQQWGKRNGPPYPLRGGDYSARERKAVYTERRKHPNSIYNKKHFDEVLKKGTTLSTLSYDENRTKGADMFYATHKKLDQHQYNALFNRPIPKTQYDENGNAIGTGEYLKYKIKNKATVDLKVASEDSGAEYFRQLYKKDRDFYNFVTDPERMQSHFVKDKYKFRGYREARAALEKLRNGKTPTEDELQQIYRMFNYVIPSDGGGDARRAKDVVTQRAKFFKALEKAGYAALLDTNDGIYGGFKATSPVIVFNQSAVVLQGYEQTSMRDKRLSELITAGRKAVGI